MEGQGLHFSYIWYPFNLVIQSGLIVKHDSLYVSLITIISSEPTKVVPHGMNKHKAVSL